MIHQSWRNTKSHEDFLERLDGRIAALAQSHKLLVESDWLGADLRRLIESQLAAYLSDNASRVHLRGPQVSLPPDVATPFGLVLHELATNAVKYGSLSGENGEVQLYWQMLERNDDSILRVVWKEENGPRVVAPRRSGFGSRLIKRGLPEATVEHKFVPDGVECVVELPLSAHKELETV